MPIRLLALLLLLSLSGCGTNSSDEASAPDAEVTMDEDETASEDDGASAPPPPQTTPISAEVTVAGEGVVGQKARYVAKGTTDTCMHNPQATDTNALAEWGVHFENASDPNFPGLVLNIHKTRDGVSSQFYLMLQAGHLEALGTRMPLVSNIATITANGGAAVGKGTARVSRVGEGVKIEVEGVSSQDIQIHASIVCERLVGP